MEKVCDKHLEMERKIERTRSEIENVEKKIEAILRKLDKIESYFLGNGRRGIFSRIDRLELMGEIGKWAVIVSASWLLLQKILPAIFQKL